MVSQVVEVGQAESNNLLSNLRIFPFAKCKSTVRSDRSERLREVLGHSELTVLMLSEKSESMIKIRSRNWRRVRSQGNGGWGAEGNNKMSKIFQT